jgi:hypothetical protein
VHDRVAQTCVFDVDTVDHRCSSLLDLGNDASLS